MMDKKGVTRARTKVDLFLELIDKSKEISLKDAAAKIGVSEEIAGLWAETLEESEKLRIEYKVATPYLVSAKLSKEQQKALEKTRKKESVEKKKQGFSDKLGGLFKKKPKEGPKPLPKVPTAPKKIKPKVQLEKPPEKAGFLDRIKKGFSTIFKKEAPIDKLIDQLNKKLLAADNIKIPDIRTKYKKLVSILIENYNHIKSKQFKRLLTNYDLVYKLLTQELSTYLLKNDPVVKREVLDFYSLLVYYKRVENLKFIKENDPKRKLELKKINELYNKLKPRKELKEAIDTIKGEIKWKLKQKRKFPGQWKEEKSI